MLFILVRKCRNVYNEKRMSDLQCLKWEKSCKNHIMLIFAMHSSMDIVALITLGSEFQEAS